MKKKKGFTLIEIIVCIGLIAVVSVGSIIGIKLVDKKLVINELNQISDKVLNAAEVYIETNKETYNQLYNEKNVTVIPLVTLVNEGYLTLDGTSLTTEKITDKYVTTFLAAKSEENTSECTDITTVFSWEKNSSPIYICTSTTADTSELESEIAKLRNDLEEHIKNNSSDIVCKDINFNKDSNKLSDKILSSACNTANDKDAYSLESNGLAVYREESATKVVEQHSASTEASLSKTEDYNADGSQNGYSYYFRGNVENNYVTFAGMCWRVVRIDGSGNVKIILEDQDEECSSTMTGNWDIPTITGGSTKIGIFGGYLTMKNNNTKLLSYNSPSSEYEDYSQVTAYKNFQKGVLTNKIKENYNNQNLSDYLVSGVWCYDELSYTSITGEGKKIKYFYTIKAQIESANGVNNIEYYTDSYVRLVGKSTKEPTLKCNGTILNKYSDNTDMYVATLTADEIVYAGGYITTTTYSDYNSYLVNNWQKSNSKYFWTMSPMSPYLGFMMNYHGYLSKYSYSGKYNDASLNASFRPAVTLKSSITVTGSGTKTDPYKVS